MMHQDSLEPAAIADLRSNPYKSLPGDQDIFSLLFSCLYIHRNPRKWLISFASGMAAFGPTGNSALPLAFQAQA